MAARKAGIVLASGTVYVSSVYLAYLYFSPEKKKEEDVTASSLSSFSYVNDPHRNCTYQRIATDYDAGIGRDETFMGIRLLRRALIHRHARGNVLEVAAGTGRNLDYYRLGDSSSSYSSSSSSWPPSWWSPTVDQLSLTDSSDRMLAEAERKIALLRDRARVLTRVADATRLPYADDSFDTVVDTFGLCSFDDPVAALKEMARVCKKDGEGRILLLEHGTSESWDGLARYLDRHAEHHARTWGCVWNRKVRDVVARAGLKVETLDTWHFGTTYYIVCRPGEKAEDEDDYDRGGHENKGETIVASCSCKNKYI